MVPLLLLGCADPHSPPPAPLPEAVIQITTGLSDDACGESPRIKWSGTPAETASIALTLIEPSLQGPWVHWMAWDIPPEPGGLSAGIRPTRAPPTQGISSGGAVGYQAPCPTSPARYELRVFALDASLALPPTATWAELGAAIQPRTLAWGVQSIEVSGADN